MLSVDLCLLHSAQVPPVVLECVLCFPWTQPRLKAFLICVALSASSRSVSPVIRLSCGASPGSLPGKHTCGSEGPGGPTKAQLLPRLHGPMSVSCPLSWLTPITPLVLLLQGLQCSRTAHSQPPSPLQAFTRAYYVGAIWRLEDSNDEIRSTLAGHTPRPGPSPRFLTPVGQELYSKLSMNTTPLILFFKSDRHDDLGCQFCTFSWLINKQIQAIVHFLSHFLPVITYVSGSWTG